MKVGDLIMWESILNDDMDHNATAYGIILKLSRTGSKTKSAQILFSDGEIAWFDTQRLVLISEGG